MRTALIFLLVLGVAHAEPPKSTLDIQADRLELTQKSGEIRFEGHVIARQDTLELRCTRLIARSHQGGEVDSLVADGGVSIQTGRLSAKAKTARYDRKKGTLVLTGNPTVKRGKDRLSGARITFWPETGRMVIEQAKGQISVPRIADLDRRRPTKKAP